MIKQHEANYIIGIDPGLSGGMAIIDPSHAPGVLDPLIVSATMAYATKRGNRSELDIYKTAEFIKPHTKKIKLAVIEDVSAMPGQGVVSMFTFGKVMGVVLGVLGAFNIPVVFVTPSTWKGNLNLDTNKYNSFKLATDVFGSNNFWPLKKHDGVAEAALLAYFGIRFL